MNAVNLPPDIHDDDSRPDRSHGASSTPSKATPSGVLPGLPGQPQLPSQCLTFQLGG